MSQIVVCPDCDQTIAVVTTTNAVWAAIKAHDCTTAPRGTTMTEAPTLHAVPSGKRPHPRELVTHPDKRIARAAQKVLDAVARLDEAWADRAHHAALKEKETRLRRELAQVQAQLRGETGTAAGRDWKAIRAWAKANGIDCPPTGRVPGRVIDAYDAQGSA